MTIQQKNKCIDHAGRPAWSFFVRTNSGIEIQGRVDQAPYEHTITRPRCSFHLHVCTCVHTCANVLHTCFFSFIRLFSLKTALVQCVHFFLTFLIYIHIYKTYIKHKNVIYRFYKKKLHKVHTMKILAIYECFLLEIACILTAHRVHTLHTIDDMGLILSVTSCVTAE